MTDISDEMRPFFTGVIDFLHERSGMTEFQIRYSGSPEFDNEDDEQSPRVWVAVGHWAVQDAWLVGAALTPMGAANALAERALDGGMCLRCGRMMAFLPYGDDANDPEVLGLPSCSVKWDEGEAAYVRSCQVKARSN
jgi:hypothetical protein